MRIFTLQGHAVIGKVFMLIISSALLDVNTEDSYYQPAQQPAVPAQQLAVEVTSAPVTAPPAPVTPSPAPVTPAATAGSTSTHVTKIICLGDSITFGTPDASYPARLGQLLGADYSVENEALSAAEYPPYEFPYSDDADDWVEKWQQHSPKYFIVMLGTNASSINRQVPGANGLFAKRYHHLLKTIKKVKPKPTILMAIPPPAYFSAFNVDASLVNLVVPPLVQKIHSEYDNWVPLIDLFNTMGGKDLTHKEWFPDGIHCNKDGCSEMAKIVYDALAQLRPDLKAREHTTSTLPYGVTTSTAPKALDYVRRGIRGVEKEAEAAEHTAKSFTMSHWQRIIVIFLLCLIFVIPCCACYASLSTRPNQAKTVFYSSMASQLQQGRSFPAFGPSGMQSDVLTRSSFGTIGGRPFAGSSTALSGNPYSYTAIRGQQPVYVG